MNPQTVNPIRKGEESTLVLFLESMEPATTSIKMQVTVNSIKNAWNEESEELFEKINL